MKNDDVISLQICLSKSADPGKGSSRMFSNKTHAPTYSLGMDEDFEESQERFRLFRLNEE